MSDPSQPSAKPPDDSSLVHLDLSQRIWDRFFMVAPLVVIGTREESGEYDLAPKHMVTALSWDNYFGFVCTPSHATYRNVQREGVFTVSFPRADQVVLASLAASPRCDDQSKPIVGALPTFRSRRVEGVFLMDATLYFECRLHSIVDGFGDNSLIAGQIVGAMARPEILRRQDQDDQDLLHQSPLLAYLSPGRFCQIQRSQSFPFPKGFRKEPES